MRRLLLLIVCLSVACGDDDGPPSTFRCTDDEGCDDDIACTVDSCGVDGACNHVPVNERCGPGELCDLTRGCTGQCMRNEDCNDGVDCTLDNCAVGGVCQATPLNERCPSGQMCDPDDGCGMGMRPDAGGPGTCMSSAECDDRIDCTVDSCGADMRCQHIAQNSRCDMGRMCNPTSGCAMQCEGPEDCQDGVLCNGVETCDPEFGCAPAELAEDCEDGDPCTLDSCNVATDTCSNTCNTSDTSCADERVCAEPPMGMFPATYDLMPTVSHACSSLVAEAFFTWNSITFDVMGPVLIATPMPSPRRMGCEMLSQTPVPTDGSFDVSCEVTGECVESFHLTGRFVDADHIMATFSATYVAEPGGLIGCGEIICGEACCRDQNVPVMGTRRRPPM